MAKPVVLNSCSLRLWAFSLGSRRPGRRHCPLTNKTLQLTGPALRFSETSGTLQPARQLIIVGGSLRTQTTQDTPAAAVPTCRLGTATVPLLLAGCARLSSCSLP